MTETRQKGDRGEDLAARYLQSVGFEILHSNFHSRYGEIDLIARDKETLVFVEVKHYKLGSMRSPYESITRSKQQKLIKTARYYLLLHPVDMPMRFDVVFFEDEKLLDHLRGAFVI